jgi:hypothetical protein
MVIDRRTLAPPRRAVLCRLAQSVLILEYVPAKCELPILAKRTHRRTGRQDAGPATRCDHARSAPRAIMQTQHAR